jgi:preprotein translocase subunit SecA
MRKVERDIYMQVLDNLWMQHLENMQHMREGIHWLSVGQRDPLVEYRRQSQRMFEEMQQTLRHDVVRALFHAQPISAESLDTPTETELTRAARKSVDNANQILSGKKIGEEDFQTKKDVRQSKKDSSTKRKKARKKQRQNRKKARK